MKASTQNKKTPKRQKLDLAKLNDNFAKLDVKERFEIIRENFSGQVIASTSAGVQSVVLLHMLSKYASEIPVVLIDTGYLFPETYNYFEQLEKLFKNLEFKVYTPKITPAMQEAKYGKLWKKGLKGHQKYALINKIEPMSRALSEHSATAWISGLRKTQSDERKFFDFFMQQNKTTKIYPILDWSEEQTGSYIYLYDLPTHPLLKKGYISVGDWHSTKPVDKNNPKEKARFDGIKRECGLHLDSNTLDYQI